MDDGVINQTKPPLLTLAAAPNKKSTMALISALPVRCCYSICLRRLEADEPSCLGIGTSNKSMAQAALNESFSKWIVLC
jgi:hypothetical protein